MNETTKAIHPGIQLKETWVKKEKITIQKAADILGVKRRALSSVLNGQVPISESLAQKLSAHFGMPAEAYLLSQKNYKETVKAREISRPKRHRAINKKSYYESWKALEIKKEDN